MSGGVRGGGWTEWRGCVAGEEGGAVHLSRISVECIEVAVDDVGDGVCEADVEMPSGKDVNDLDAGRVRRKGAGRCGRRTSSGRSSRGRVAR